MFQHRPGASCFLCPQGKGYPASALPFGVSYETFRNPGPTFQLTFEGPSTSRVAPQPAHGGGGGERGERAEQGFPGSTHQKGSLLEGGPPVGATNAALMDGRSAENTETNLRTRWEQAEHHDSVTS